MLFSSPGKKLFESLFKTKILEEDVRRHCASRGYRAQARQGPIKVISEQMTNVDGRYLALLYLGGYYLSSLLYDVNQQVALLQQLVLLPRRVHLDRSTDNRQSTICSMHVFWLALHRLNVKEDLEVA